jgi:hypothetical protein
MLRILEYSNTRRRGRLEMSRSHSAHKGDYITPLILTAAIRTASILLHASEHLPVLPDLYDANHVLSRTNLVISEIPHISLLR